MTPEHRALLAEVSAELRNKQHPTFDLADPRNCIGGILGRKLGMTDLGSIAVAISESQDEIDQVLILFWLIPHPTNHFGLRRDQPAAADRIDHLLATGSVWP